jgi:hypothetical protein
MSEVVDRPTGDAGKPRRAEEAHPRELQLKVRRDGLCPESRTDALPIT